MRIVAMLTAALLISALPARAQSSRDRGDDTDHRIWKVLIGGGAMVAGTAVAARSHNTTTVQGPFGTSETSEFSKSQLITGLAVAGTGGIILWDGLRDHDPRRPSTQVAFDVGRHATRIVWRRRW